jgi:hypothetical protein
MLIEPGLQVEVESRQLEEPSQMALDDAEIDIAAGLRFAPGIGAKKGDTLDAVFTSDIIDDRRYLFDTENSRLQPAASFKLSCHDDTASPIDSANMVLDRQYCS